MSTPAPATLAPNSIPRTIHAPHPANVAFWRTTGFQLPRTGTSVLGAFIARYATPVLDPSPEIFVDFIRVLAAVILAIVLLHILLSFCEVSPCDYKLETGMVRTIAESASVLSLLRLLNHPFCLSASGIPNGISTSPPGVSSGSRSAEYQLWPPVGGWSPITLM